MTNIQSNLNKIKNAVLGIEVRDSIHDAIKQCYDDASAKDNANMEVKMARGEYENLGKRLDSHSSQIKEKANIVDLAVERARIDTFTSLPEGSTTGDAELIDGRIGTCGNSYDNIGDAIRTQVKTIRSDNSNIKTFNTSNIINNTIYIPFEAYKGQEIEILVQSNNVISSASRLAIGCSTGSQDVDDIVKIYADTTSSFIVPLDFKIIRIYIPSSAILTDGNFNVTIKHKKNIYEELNALNTFELNQNIENKEIKKILLGFDNGDVEIKHTKEDIPVIAKNTISKNISNVNMKQGETVHFLLKDDNFILNTECEIAVGFNYVNSGSVADQIKLKPNVENSIVLSEDINGIAIWCGGGNILHDGNLELIISNIGTLSIMEMLKNKTSLNSQTMSIIGDSYSTYEGWIPSDYACWYKESGNEDSNNDVADVKNTWWWQLSKETGLSLLVNNSYSGSTISTSGYGASDSTPTAFVTRMKMHMGEDRALQPKPNIIFIFGGTNDTWASSPVGDVKYSGWTTDDLKSVLPAFCYMLDYLKKWNPQARIINIVNTGLKDDISNGMNIACEYYGIENVVLNNISKTGGHPNKAGMISIKNQVISIL